MARSTAGTIKDVLPAGLTYVAGSADEQRRIRLRRLRLRDTHPELDGHLGDRQWERDLQGHGRCRRSRKDPAAPQRRDHRLGRHRAGQRQQRRLRGAAAAGRDLRVPTAPRTDVLDSSGTATPGMNLGLVLLIIGVLAFAVLFVTPMPASTKNRIRRR